MGEKVDCNGLMPPLLPFKYPWMDSTPPPIKKAPGEGNWSQSKEMDPPPNLGEPGEKKPGEKISNAQKGATLLGKKGEKGKKKPAGRGGAREKGNFSKTRKKNGPKPGGWDRRTFFSGLMGVPPFLKNMGKGGNEWGAPQQTLGFWGDGKTRGKKTTIGGPSASQKEKENPGGPTYPANGEGPNPQNGILYPKDRSRKNKGGRTFSPPQGGEKGNPYGGRAGKKNQNRGKKNEPGKTTPLLAPGV
ncbi:hypothetical protein JTB14_008948 [Gonioctena quinquepunctata]|nr:hypothetical protein JTB14_008948 [Gonioctena quinquepunctata]